MRRAMVHLCVSFLLLTAWALTLNAQGVTENGRIVPEIKALRINPHPPVIDGKLDDTIWQNHKLMTVNTFIQVEPDESSPATDSTRVAVAYDEDALYVAFWCYHSDPTKIRKQLVRRDRWSEADRVTLRLDSYHDHQNGNAFEVSVAGVKRDCRYYNDTWSDMSWDANWEADVATQPWGWTAEYRIPYHCLRFAEKDEHVWGIDFQRYISEKNETSRWAFVPSSVGGFVSKFGHLTGLKDIHSGKHVELLPYVVSSTESEPKSLGNPDGRDYLSDVGFDLKYALSSNLILDATINPDFGQVELDQPVINLSVYETWFSERRPFFMEGSNLYDTDFNLFYSRRIGRPPRQHVDDPEYAYYNDYPNETTILGAAKITGKLPTGTSIAFLNAYTSEEKAEYTAYSNWQTDPQGNEVPLDTATRKGVVEPQANYSVLRIKQDIFGNSHVGGFLTLASQESVRPAITGSVDWRLYTKNNAWIFEGQTVFSKVDDGKTGFGFDTEIQKSAGEHFRGELDLTIKDPNLNLNRLGYMSRNNSKSIGLWMQYRTSDDWWIIRNSWNNLNIYSSWNYDNINYNLGGNVNGYIEFRNNWGMNWNFAVQAEKFSDLETRGNGLWQWPVYPTTSTSISFETDQRKKLSFHLGGNVGTDRGGDYTGVWFYIGTRPRSNIELSSGIRATKYNNITRWVTNTYDESGTELKSVFGDLNQDVISIDLSASILFTRDFSFQVSAVGLLSGLDYQNYRYYEGGNDYSEPIEGFNADYNYTALNSTMLLRWEYIPGSTLYLVWTRARPEVDPNANNLVLNRDFDRFFSRGSSNVFLAKISYWLNI